MKKKINPFANDYYLRLDVLILEKGLKLSINNKARKRMYLRKSFDSPNGCLKLSVLIICSDKKLDNYRQKSWYHDHYFIIITQARYLL